MATSSGVKTRSQSKVLTTTIEPVFSDDEESDHENFDGKSTKDKGKMKENVAPKHENDEPVIISSTSGEPIIISSVSDEPVSQSTKSPTLPDKCGNSVASEIVSAADNSQVVESSNSNNAGNKVHHDGNQQKSSERNGEGEKTNSDNPNVTKSVAAEANNDTRCSSTELRASLNEAIAAARIRHQAPKQFDDDYEDDGFVLKARRKSGEGPSNGHVPAVDTNPEIDDDDMRRINALFGDYEYENQDDTKEQSDDESILSDPSDLHEESGPEEEDLIEDDIENYGKNDKPVETNPFLDDQAVEDNTMDDDDANDTIIEPRFSSDESSHDEDEDRTIRSPLKKKDFLDEEACEDNNLRSLYGWTDCSPTPSEEIASDWKWNHEESDEDEEDDFTEDEDSDDEDSDDKDSDDEDISDGSSDYESVEEETPVDPTDPLWIIFDSVRNYKDTNGHSAADIFTRLPSSRKYPDYYTEIKKPISLSEIKKNIRVGDYKNASLLVEDLNLMFENAKKYNRLDSKIYKDACKMQKVMRKKAQELIKNTFSLDTSDEEEGNEKVLQPKRKLRVIEDDDDDIQVVGPEIKSPSKQSQSNPNEVIEKNNDSVNKVNQDPTIYEDCVIASTSSVFIVKPLDPNYQPGRNNRQIFRVRPLNSSQDEIMKNVKKGESSTNKKKNENSAPDFPNKRAKTSNIPYKFILDHDLMFIIEQRKKFKNGSQKMISELDGLLKKGLEKRATVISVKEFEENGKCRIFVGMTLNIDHAYETVVKGPSADNIDEVKSFENVWGSKVETRRYPDLSILASVHFPAATLSEKRNIVPEIVHHLVTTHFKIAPEDVTCYDHHVQAVLKCKQLQIHGTGEEELLSLSQSFEGLRKKIRDLKDLPLGISSIKGISPSFRGAEVFCVKTNGILGHVVESNIKESAGTYGCSTVPENSKFIPSLIKPHEVLIELETSGKWPDDVTAVRQVKTQILYNLMAQIYLNHKLPVKLSENYLDILHESFVFRIFLAVKKEVVLQRQFQSGTGLMLAKRGQIHEADELEMKNECLPKLTSALNGIATQFISYNTVVRLAKRWLSSQYLHTLVSDLLIELVVAYIYLNDCGYTGSPNAPLTGFLRFLELVSKFKWSKEPLFVNINQEFDERKMSEIKKSFQQSKGKPSFLISTPYDLSPGYFTKVKGNINSSPIFDTFVRNARSSFNCLMEMIRGTELFNFTKIFLHPSEDYHVIIDLKHEFVATSSLSLKSSIVVPPRKKKKAMIQNLMPVTDFDVVKIYLESLRECFVDQAIFFYDHFGGTQILVYFTPETLREWSKPTQSKDQTCQYEKMIDDFRIMGHGIVANIKVNTDKWT